MSTDTDYIAERKRHDEHVFLTGTTDPDVAPRLAPGIRALRERLTQGPASWDAAMAAALRPTDLAVKTVDNVVRRLIAAGFVVKTGEYSRTYNRKRRTWAVKDTRTLALGDWPAPTH